MKASFPAAVEPFYSSARANEPIGLFRGRVDLVGPCASERHRGGVVLEWLPSPTLRAWAYGTGSELALQSISGNANLEIAPRTPRRNVPRQGRGTRPRRSSVRGSFETETPLLEWECGDPAAALSYGVLHVVNASLLHGSPIAWPDGSSASGRRVLRGGGWRIVLDQVRDAGDRLKELQDGGGFAITHTARVERESGERFTSSQLREIAEAFTFFCWLCMEARCGPMLPVGFDADGCAVWSRWSPTVTESFPNAVTWLDRVHAGEAEALFPSFMHRFTDRYWGQVLRHAIAYLVEAGRPHTLERAIIMAQILLEAVGYSWLVEERKLRTHDEFERRKTAQNIHEMLLAMKVPARIPATMPALAATRNKKGHRVDGPGALVIKRNEIVHRRGNLPTPDYPALIDAWKLGAWYSELAVLRICGFNGLYRSRLSEDTWVGSVEPVPWRQEMDARRTL